MLQLTRREKRFALGLAIFIAAWTCYGSIIKPALARLETLQRVIPEKQTTLSRLTDLSCQYSTLAQQSDRIQQTLTNQQNDFALLPFLENIIEKSNLSEKLVSMQTDHRQLTPDYSETLATIKLEQLTLNQLVQCLAEIHSANPCIRIKSLNLQKNPQAPKKLDPTIQIANLQLHHTNN